MDELTIKIIIGVLALLIFAWVARSFFKGFEDDRAKFEIQKRKQRQVKFSPKSTKEQFAENVKSAESSGAAGGYQGSFGASKKGGGAPSDKF